MSQKNSKGYTPPASSALSDAVQKEAAAQDQQAADAAAAAAANAAGESTGEGGNENEALDTVGTGDQSTGDTSKAADASATSTTPTATTTSAGAASTAPLSGAVQTKTVSVASGVTVTKTVEKTAGVGRTTSSAAVVATDELQERLDRILKDVPAASYNDITRIRIYCKNMAPGKQLTPAAGAAEQSALYRSIQNIINRQGTYFTPLFTALLAVFAAERTAALGDRYRNRFMEHVVLSQSDRNAFLSLTHLLSVTADPKSRELALKQLDLELALENGLTAEGKLRVLGYFGK